MEYHITKAPQAIYVGHPVPEWFAGSGLSIAVGVSQILAAALLGIYILPDLLPPEASGFPFSAVIAFCLMCLSVVVAGCIFINHGVDRSAKWRSKTISPESLRVWEDLFVAFHERGRTGMPAPPSADLSQTTNAQLETWCSEWNAREASRIAAERRAALDWARQHADCGPAETEEAPEGLVPQGHQEAARRCTCPRTCLIHAET